MSSSIIINQINKYTDNQKIGFQVVIEVKEKKSPIILVCGTPRLSNCVSSSSAIATHVPLLISTLVK